MMRARQREIEARYQAIEGEKETIARRVAQTWWAECSQVTRAAEHGLLVVLLNGLEKSLSAFRQRTGTVVLDNRFQDISIDDLTADASSLAWHVGCGLYRAW